MSERGDDMSHRAWVRCEKKSVQAVKKRLEDNGLLTRDVKVRRDEDQDYMLVPTTFTCQGAGSDVGVTEDATFEQLLQDLRDQKIESVVVYIPQQSQDARSGAGRGNARPPASQLFSLAIFTWLESLPPSAFHSSSSQTSLISSLDIPQLLSRAPKRWSVYHPMLLLPAGSFQNPEWVTLLSRVDEESREKLYTGLLAAVDSETSSAPLTHLAVNAGIPLHARAGEQKQDEETIYGEDAEKDDENILRSPSGLLMLHGNFGPEKPSGENEVTEQDLEKAFWVRVTQNGIHQTWAPRWTMFSRGNVTEKARLLRFHTPEKTLPSTGPASSTPGISQRVIERRLRAMGSLAGAVAVDLYAGIGYFALCYAKMGFKVLCWEINPWSVEGLRRGGEMNGLGVGVVQRNDPTPQLRPQTNLTSATGTVGKKGKSRGKESRSQNIVAFLEGNEYALDRLKEMKRDDEEKTLGPIRHVNGGFLPTSEPSWKSAWEMVDKQSGSWLHLHENVAVADIDPRRMEIEAIFRGWAEGMNLVVEVEHVELVKTYAPGVWHCVFDVYVGPQE